MPAPRVTKVTRHADEMLGITAISGPLCLPARLSSVIRCERLSYMNAIGL